MTFGYNGNMSRLELSPDKWTKILQFLRSRTELYVGQEEECRRFIEAVLWIDRSGAQWRLLPAEYGNWNSVYKRFARWSDRGIWELLHQHLADDPDMEYLIIDSTVVRAHPCAAAPSQGLGCLSAFLGGAPAAQGWARTTVLSMMRYSISGSSAKC